MTSTLPLSANVVRSRAGKPDRFPRFTSPREDYTPDEDDHALLRVVERFRLIDIRQLELAAVVPHIGHRRLQDRLNTLFRSDHVTRPLSQLSRWWTKRRSTLPYVYGLGAAGFAALHPDQAGRKRTAVLRLRDRRIGSSYIDHRLKLTTALLCFEQAAAAEDFRLTWSEGDAFRAATGLPRYVTVPTQRTTVDLPISPDAYLTLAGDAGSRHYFLEIDNGTEPIERTRRRWERTSIHRKLAVYDELAPRKDDKEADRRRRSPFRFRVLTITTTPARMESMRQLARDQDPKHKGSRLFLFTTDARVTLEQPGDILDQPIWWTPNDDDQPVALTD